MLNQERLASRLRPRLELLYGPRADACLARIMILARDYAPALQKQQRPAWDERDVVLITYGDQVRVPDAPPLRALARFLTDAGLDRLIRNVHLLPFYPYSTDDGFSVIDYRAVDPALGDWPDVHALVRKHHLMFDLVLNHISRKSKWFSEYCAGREPYVRYFIEVDPGEDLSAVTRPRALPLLTPVETSRGVRHVWTTFSDDQIDLDFAEPDVLVEMLEILLFYLHEGARIVRLDAIAYLWKRIGTPCIHLPETHAVVKIMRDLADELAPGAILLTETNVPHEENVSYFGDGDEAQMVYQFSLAPLLLEALISGDASLLHRWLADLEAPRPGTTYFNFTASHDGVGVRPLEGLMPRERQDRLLAAVLARGGHISARRSPSGQESPYELNITYFDALSDPDRPDRELQIRRFLASQAAMLSLQGIPGIYFHSLVATPNDVEGVRRTGRARSINRRKFEFAHLAAAVTAPGTAPATVLDAYRRMLATRIGQPAFHPDAAQHVLPLVNPAVLGLVRGDREAPESILVIVNAGPARAEIDVRAWAGRRPRVDLLGPAERAPLEDRVVLEPYQVMWLTL